MSRATPVQGQEQVTCRRVGANLALSLCQAWRSSRTRRPLQADSSQPHQHGQLGPGHGAALEQVGGDAGGQAVLHATWGEAERHGSPVDAVGAAASPQRTMPRPKSQTITPGQKTVEPKAFTNQHPTCSESTADMFMPTASRMTITPIHLSMLLFSLIAPRACRERAQEE